MSICCAVAFLALHGRLNPRRDRERPQPQISAATAQRTFRKCFCVPWDADIFLAVTPENIEDQADISSLMPKYIAKISEIIQRRGEKHSCDLHLIRMEIQFKRAKFFIDRNGCVKSGKGEYLLSPKDFYDLKVELFLTIPMNVLPPNPEAHDLPQTNLAKKQLSRSYPFVTGIDWLGVWALGWESED